MTPDRAAREAALTAEITELCEEEKPRLFTIAEIDVDNDDGWILAWGMAFKSRVVVYTEGRATFHGFSSVDRVVRALSRGRTTRLIWHDHAILASPHEQ